MKFGRENIKKLIIYLNFYFSLWFCHVIFRISQIFNFETFSWLLMKKYYNKLIQIIIKTKLIINHIIIRKDMF